MKSLRILHIETGKTWRGSQREVLYTLVGQRKRGHDSRLVCPPGVPLAARAKTAGIPIYEIPMVGEIDPRTVYRINQLLKSFHPEVVHLQSSHAHVLGGIATRLTKVPAVILNRWLDFPIDKNIFSKIKYQYFYDMIITVTEAVKQILVEGGVNPEKITAVYPAIEASEYQIPETKNRLRHELGLAPYIPVVGLLAYLEYRKGAQTLLGAAPKILKVLPETKFLIVGEGPYKDHLIKMTAELGLTQSVIFPGFKKDVARVLAMLDVLTVPSYLEAGAVCLIEGMATGIPLVSSTAGGNPELVQDRVNGLLVPPKDADKLAKAILTLLTDKPLAQQLVATGNKIVREKFNIDTMVDAILNVYRGVLVKKNYPDVD
ncbi:MAG: glycosyltransferase family 4 protein [bacterium]